MCPSQNPKVVFFGPWQTDSKIQMEEKLDKDRQSQFFFSNSWKELYLPNIKIYNQTIIIKTKSNSILE